MRSLTFLLSFLLFLSCADAYTLILKNGRRCAGALISDSGSTIQFRDAATGVTLSFKKELIDAGATAAANEHAPAVAPGPAPSSADSPRGLALLAAQVRERRTGKARVYTAADLEHAPELSISGSGDVVAYADSAMASETAKPDEARWRKEARAVRKDLESAEDHAAAAESACEKARRRNQLSLRSSHRHPADLPSLTEQPPECRRLEDMRRRLSEARERSDAFEERARRAGIPWQWLE